MADPETTQRSSELVKRQNAQSLLIEQMRKALMVAHADNWDMDTAAEAAYICAQVALPIEPTRA